MKPNFALSLSFDGIRLLHRAAGGWRVVGEVSLAAEDMAAELAALRKTASDLEPRGVRSKLVIPNEQIRYLTIDSGDTEGRWSAAFAALEGATPYAVDDLSIDICADGAQTHIAAVARETLDEAEAFAMQHRFHPVSFVSIPGEAGFLGEPFLGVTSHAADLLEPGDEVTPDGIAVVVIGDIKTPVGPVVTEDVTPVAAEPKPPVAEAEVPAPVEDVQAESVEAPAADPKPAPEAETRKPEPPKPDATPDAADPDPAAFGFASRRATAANPPALGGANRKDTSAATAPVPASPRVTPVPAADKPAQAPPKADAKPTSENAATPMDLAKASVTGFMSRRRKPKRINPAAAPIAQTAHPITDPPADEAQRMTVFGARSKPGDKVGGKPRYMGLILTAALLVFLAGVAAWASVFLDEGLARFFNRAEDPVVVEAPPEILPEPDPEQIEDGAEVASLDPSLSDEDAAVLDALGDPQAQPEEEPAIDPERERQAAEARYAVTGIWPLAPQEPEAAPVIPLEDLYVASIDPVSPARDAVALPAPASLDTDLALVALPSPAAAGTSFARDGEGRVIPTEDGAVTPNGVTLYKGRPAVVPPPTPTRFAEAPEVNPELERLGRARPRARPTDLIENAERASLGGLTRNELAEVRPKLRPAVAKVEEEKDEVPTAQAATVSFRPNGRPRNFDTTVARARAAQPEPTQAAAVAPVTTTAPVAVAPKIPSKTSVAAGATVKNAINLRKVNLIGVYGKPSSRRALVRLSNGRYQKVQVGDRIDGGRVSAIGDSELRYQKGSRSVVLKMP
ncbi:hypothetical protein JQX09_20175 [Sulfitobacter pseudonitzschiae]|uniref:Type IV pilus biogenesis n=1 Tax=Pseudosulfitobacter pseudonitzschiae TaxID=1402135 RepID=A0A9Q2NLH8_9RHOB|nr:hypothetical protein [Pseudosulfitobacter pseudonitzschiae]MBM2294249.1 hypothetical protein [Pseudosulfitobacter pseudonitzschiae]MBM2299173.1 hypothetical protein [Pseudosulfitobacter pseudonitzschiae]MBM2304081.1 hypothetical protein [Pseudosulfitobacter pseudonitzschiae]MBM2313862.1 hypothetical protein [Pseudosulfitobacter pseudonitzschiae]MBM2318776.1 hypothetical protein [Pseudosulfitobacter pseudonitzschiae]